MFEKQFSVRQLLESISKTELNEWSLADFIPTRRVIERFLFPRSRVGLRKTVLKCHLVPDSCGVTLELAAYKTMMDANLFRTRGQASAADVGLITLGMCGT